MGLGSFVKKAVKKANPIRAVKKAYNAVTGKDQRRAEAQANRVAAEQERKFKMQQANAEQSARKNRSDSVADASALPGLGFEPVDAGDTSLAGLGDISLDGKLKRKKLGGA